MGFGSEIFERGVGVVGQVTTAPAMREVWHAPWQEWLRFYNYQLAITAVSTFLVLVLSWWLLSRIFRRWLEKYRLMRVTRWGAVAAILYFTMLAAHPLLMTDPYDVIAVTIHKTFVAILGIVLIRYFDRLVVVPLLTRITGGPPSRFIHQIIITVVSVFVVATYCSWAFSVELGPLLTGSAVISIVIGLALQETLGNFFSGMVLQASVPFKTGDWIQVGSVEGRVVEMTWRAVTLITGSNNYVLIPNSSVAKEQIVNYHEPSVATATNVLVGLDYSIPPNEAKRVLMQAARDTPGVLAEPLPSVALANFDDSAVQYKLIFWINEPEKHGGIEQGVRVNLWYRLNQAGYGIPYPVRTVELTDLNKKQVAAKDDARAMRLGIIRKSPMFSEIAPELQEKLAGETRGYELSAGQVFYRQNDPGDSLFILESGEVNITFLTEDGRELQVTEFGVAGGVWGGLGGDGSASCGDVSGEDGCAGDRGGSRTSARAVHAGSEADGSFFAIDRGAAEAAG